MTTRPGTGVDVQFVDRWTLRYERTYSHPIERVFQAVSEPEHLSEWMLGPHQVDLREGGRFEFTLGNDTRPGVVSQLEPPLLVEFAFTGVPPSRLRFELEAIEESITHLVLYHQWGPVEGSDLPGFSVGTSDGWELLLAYELPNHLEGCPPVRTKDVSELGAHYERFVREELPPPPKHSPLATFDSRYAMRHIRVFEHPVELVWSAVTDPEQMEAWMLPHITVEPRIGGRVTFTWGGTPDSPFEHTILEWDPPRVVDYGGLRFELEALGGSRTRLTFLQSFPPDFRQDSPAPTGDPGGDLPGGPDTPWRPGFVAGFHLMLDDLAKLLSKELDPRADWIDGRVPNELRVYPPEWVWLCHLYRGHIKVTIPKNGRGGGG